MTPVTASLEAHISMTVGGQKYNFIIDPNSFSEVDVIDWAPRAISGTPHRSELGNYLDVGQEDFGHGYGFERFEEEASYAWTGHGVDTSHGFAQLYTAPTAVHNLTDWRINKMIIHRGKKLFATENISNGTDRQGIYVEKANGVLARIGSAGIAGMRDIISNGKHFFVTRNGCMMVGDAIDVTGSNASQIIVDSDTDWTTDLFASGACYVYEGTGAGDTYTVTTNSGYVLTMAETVTPLPDGTSKIVVIGNTGVGGNPPNYFNKLWIFGGYMWGAEYDKSWVHPWSELDGLDAEGAQDTDAAAVPIGPGQVPINNMKTHQNQLWVFREDGAWIVGDDNIAYHILDYSKESHSSNFQTVCVWNGFLYFSIRNNLLKYKSGLQNVTPPLWDEHWPYKTFGDYVGLTPMGDFLYVIGRSNETNSLETTETQAFASLMKTDGVGWHKVSDISHASGIDRAYGVWADPVDNRLWYAYNAADGSDTTYLAYIQLQALSELPYASFPTSANHNLYASYVDVDMMRVDKSYASLFLDAEFPTSTSIIVYYRVDDDTALTTLGTFNSATKTVAFPSTLIGKRIQPVFNLQTSNSARSPILRAFVLKLMIRPDTLYGISCEVLVEDDLFAPGRSRLPMGKATAIRTALKAARDSKTPITFVNPWGESTSAYVASLRFVIREMEETGKVPTVARITVVNV